MERRYGAIAIASQFVREHPDILCKMFAMIEFLPMQIEEVWQEGKYIYRGYSPNFNLVEEGLCIPFYNINITQKIEEGVVDIWNVTAEEVLNCQSVIMTTWHEPERGE